MLIFPMEWCSRTGFSCFSFSHVTYSVVGSMPTRPSEALFPSLLTFALHKPYLIMLLVSVLTYIVCSPGIWEFLGSRDAFSPSFYFAASAQTLSPIDTGSATSTASPHSNTKRLSLKSRSWALNLAHSGPHIDGGLRSPFIRQLTSRNSPPRAGHIISANPVAFADKSRAGVNAKWYATRGWGWRHPENWKTRTYICMYGMVHRPCGPYDSWSEMWPIGLHCPPPHCCSKVHTVPYFGQPLCTSEWGLCAFTWDDYSYGKCRCKEGICGENAECKEEIFEHGGVYCRCKEGYFGDGKECHEDLCSKSDCFPGKCVQEKTKAWCVCPPGYEPENMSCQVIPVCDRGIENICGPPERVLRCVNVGRTDHTCVCAPGYAVINTDSGRICDLASNTLSCAQSACGSVGVEECKDNPGGGVTCTCRKGYLLEKQADGLKFKCSPIDPCQGTPCGSDTVARSCSRTVEGSYHCECQPNAELVEATDTEGPYCKRREETKDAPRFVFVAGGGVVMLAIGIGVWYAAFRSGGSTVREFDYTADAFAFPRQ